MKDIIFIINNLFLHNEIISTNNEFYIYMGFQPDILLPPETLYFIYNHVLEPNSGNLETGDVSYILADNLKDKLEDLNFISKLDKSYFLQAIRNLRLAKLEIE